MINVFNVISPLLLKVRYRNRKDPFLYFRNIIKDEPCVPVDLDKGVILIAPIRVSPVSNLFEILLSKFFRLNGYDVKLLMCNQSVRCCENFNKFSKFKKLRCALCLKEQRRVSKYFNLETININDLISQSERNEILNIVFQRTFSKRIDYIYNGIDLYDQIESGVMRYTLKSEIGKELHLIRGYAYTAFLFSKAASNIIKSYNISKVVTSHGMYSTWGAITETCNKYNIPFVVWGRGYIGQGNLLFGLNSSYAKDFVKEDSSVFQDISLTENKITTVLNYFSKKMDNSSKVDFINYYQGMKKDNSQTDDLHKQIASYKTKFGLFANIPWDGCVYKKTEHFPTIRFFTRKVLDWFVKNPDCLLIIRAHPAEVSSENAKETETFEEILRKECEVLPPNVIFVKPDSSITSYEVARFSDAIILYGSTMSLELAIQRKIVIQGGQNNVSFKNIIFDAITENDLYDYLDSVKQKELIVTDEMYNNALKYGYYWLSIRHVVDRTVVLNKLQFVEYLFSDLDSFLSNETLNFVFNKIINNQRIIGDEIHTY